MWKNARKPNGPVSFRKRRREHRREGEPCYRYAEIYTAIAREPKRRAEGEGAESVTGARTEEKTKTRGGGGGGGGEYAGRGKNRATLFFGEFSPRDNIRHLDRTERRLKINNEYQQRRGRWRFITRN